MRAASPARNTGRGPSGKCFSQARHWRTADNNSSRVGYSVSCMSRNVAILATLPLPAVALLLISIAPWVKLPMNVLGEPRGLHVVRVASKRQIVPAGVDRIGAHGATTETRKMGISNLDRLQQIRKRLSIELGI